ncbi:hypothetical protein [Parvibaculum sp.]|uniref:hypothetical protein n=1 Tax=Parvibaculum sp. TaxID=2024848 RepID=UPI003BAC58C8
MRWGVNISLLVAVSMAYFALRGIVELCYWLDDASDPDFDYSVLSLAAYGIVMNSTGAVAAACNGAGFFRQRRGAPMSWMLHLSNGLFVVVYLPVPLYALTLIYGMPSEGFFHLIFMVTLVILAAITGVYAALLRRQSAPETLSKA